LRCCSLTDASPFTHIFTVQCDPITQHHPKSPPLVTITDSSPDSITEIPQALIGVVGLFGV
jgi:hypothetical protein